MHISLFLPDGVGLRNFVLSGFLREAARVADVDVLSAAPPSWASEESHVGGGPVTWGPLQPSQDGVLFRFLRQTLLYAHMRWADTVSMRHNLARPVAGTFKGRCYHRVTRVAGRLAARPTTIRTLEGALLRSVRERADVRAYRAQFQGVPTGGNGQPPRSRPDVLLVSNQKSPAMVPAVLAARSLRIPTAAFVFSWDNLTSKGRIAVPFDHYLVWSELMGGELRRYYPRIAPSQVHVVGTPQFAPYADESLLETRAAFFERFGADPARPLICYSAAAAATVPEEPLHVRRLLELVAAKRIAGDPQVLVRPAPTDTDHGRWEEVRRAPGVFYAPPRWTTAGGTTAALETWTDVLPTAEDVRFLANLTRHADVNVNIASTMTLDFALRDKPVVNVGFDVVDPPTFGTPLLDHYYRFDHYRPVLELGAARLARTPDELAAHLDAYLADPSLDREARRRLVDLEIGVPPSRANATLLATLAEIAASGPRREAAGGDAPRRGEAVGR